MRANVGALGTSQGVTTSLRPPTTTTTEDFPPGAKAAQFHTEEARDPATS